MITKNNSLAAFICTVLASGFLATAAIAQQPRSKLTNSHSFPAFARRGLRVTAFRGQIITQNSYEAIDNAARNQARENLTKTLIILGLISGVGSLGWYLSRRSSVTNHSFIPGEKKNSDKALIDRVSPRLRRKLLRLVNDRKTVNRLLMGIQKKNSDRSPNWLAEKAIYDLQRGR